MIHATCPVCEAGAVSHNGATLRAARTGRERGLKGGADGSQGSGGGSGDGANERAAQNGVSLLWLFKYAQWTD